MGIEQLLIDKGVPYTTADQSKNVGRGWIGLQCPYCNDPSDHLGCHVDSARLTCWRCGGKRPRETIAQLLGIPKHEAKKLLKQYGVQGARMAPQYGARRRKRQGQQPIAFPRDTGELAERHRLYLHTRDFDPDTLIERYDLRATGPTARLDGIDYANRIVIPIYWGGEIVSWQARSINNKGVRYKACPVERERVHHQDILYGMPGVAWGHTLIVVEGVTDAWRLGEQAAATFGISVRLPQMLAIARTVRQVVVVFDPGDTAQFRANQVARELRSLRCDVRVVCPEREPADWSEAEVRDLLATATRAPTLA